MKDQYFDPSFESIDPASDSLDFGGTVGVVPRDKRESEVFWVRALLSKVEVPDESAPEVYSCIDDSNGKHDVIIKRRSNSAIGVQVTELTHELARGVQGKRRSFVEHVLLHVAEQDLRTRKPLLVTCQVPYVDGKHHDFPNETLLVTAIAEFVAGKNAASTVTVDAAHVRFTWLAAGQTYGLPTVNNVVLDCKLESIPRSRVVYREALKSLRDKKINSRSPWLLIWSCATHEVKQLHAPRFLNYMRELFATSHFERVFFVESVNRAELFEEKLVVHTIR